MKMKFGIRTVDILNCPILFGQGNSVSSKLDSEKDISDFVIKHGYTRVSCAMKRMRHLSNVIGPSEIVMYCDYSDEE